MRALDAILSRLESQGCGVDGVSLFAGPDVDLPSGSSAFLHVTETGGRGALGTHQEPSALRQPWFQLSAHADLYLDAAALCDRALDALEGSNRLIGDVFFLWCRAVQAPNGAQGTDANGRPIVSVNLATLCRRAA
jgi:hypothetical protein